MEGAGQTVLTPHASIEFLGPCCAAAQAAPRDIDPRRHTTNFGPFKVTCVPAPSSSVSACRNSEILPVLTLGLVAWHMRQEIPRSSVSSVMRLDSLIILVRPRGGVWGGSAELAVPPRPISDLCPEQPPRRHSGGMQGWRGAVADLAAPRSMDGFASPTARPFPCIGPAPDVEAVGASHVAASHHHAALARRQPPAAWAARAARARCRRSSPASASSWVFCAQRRPSRRRTAQGPAPRGPKVQWEGEGKRHGRRRQTRERWGRRRRKKADKFEGDLRITKSRSGAACCHLIVCVVSIIVHFCGG